MSSAVVAELLEEGGVEVSAIDDRAAIVEALQRANRDQPKQAWTFFVNISERRAPKLSVGLDGDRGVLTYWDGRTSYRPANGSNTEPVDYWRGGHHAQLAEYKEISADQVLSALDEFLASRRQPTCVEWVAD
ncbi:Imm1 family immunity protein [Saccharopolyspora sp. SCSIO 74807]|uniref:Imm1 family immunity protein n=1 Tax=Saccharopolyspora sp. SCSIO 74807 TaxID=3118084 RepID=UPI0030CD17A6